jgi:hypothetical protein
MWERDSFPELGNRPQAILNKQIVTASDILVAAFWTRLGTPTGKADSGTLEEIQEFRTSGKPILLYFSSQPVRPDSVDLVQYEKLKLFREQMLKDGLFNTYDDLIDFRDMLSIHLTKVVRNYFDDSILNSMPDVGVKNKNINIAFAQLKDQFIHFVVSVESEWLIEQQAKPLALDEAKILLRRIADSMTFYRTQLITLVDHRSIREFDNAIIKCKNLVNHRVYLDGGSSYDAFWKQGKTIIVLIKKLAKSINGGLR